MSLLLEHVTAVTMDSAQPVLKDAFVAVEGTKIASVGTARPQGEFDRVIDGTGKVLMPGLVNAHTHVEWPSCGGTEADTTCTTG